MTPEGFVCTPVCRHQRANIWHSCHIWCASGLTASVTCMAYQRGIMCLEVGGPVCIMTRTMGTSTVKHQQHSAASCTVGTGTLSDTRPAHVWGMNTGGMCRDRAPKRNSGLPSTSSTPPWVYSTVSSMWRFRGNSFDLVHPDPLSLGVKQKIGQWGRMFLDSSSCERGSSLSVSVPLQVCVENVGGLPHWAGCRTLKRVNRGSQRGQHSFEMYG